jgi:hypothetical protein
VKRTSRLNDHCNPVTPTFVMAGLDPAIHKKGVGARHKAGHDAF